jgi:hypothetical protein
MMEGIADPANKSLVRTQKSAPHSSTLNLRYLTSVLSIVPLQQFSAIAKITVYLQDQFNMRDDRAG